MTRLRILRTTVKKEVIFGWWQGKELTYEDYLKLDHNERIDFDLAKSYADTHENED